MRHPTTQGLYDYWNHVRGDRIAPGRLELDPIGLDAYLRDSFILEFVEPDHYRVRIAGARVMARLGGGVHDHNFLDLWTPSDADVIEHHLSQTVEQGQVTLLTAQGHESQGFGGFKRDRRTVELVMLPMTHVGAGIDRILCGLACLDDEAEHPRQLLDMRLAVAQAVWPAGVRLPMAEGQGAEPLAFVPPNMGSRLVKHGRRSFRVYEGGRSEAAE